MDTERYESELPELTDEEMAAIVVAARKQKQQQQAQQAYFAKLREQPVMPTAEELFAWVQLESRRADENNPRYLGTAGLTIDESNHHIVRALSLYFTGDARFESLPDTDERFAGKGRFSLDKGIALFGPVGCGKTTLMRLFSANPRESFTVTPCTVAANNYRTDGDEYFNYYTGKSNVYGSAFRHSTGGRCFDDLGVEPIPVNHYANKRNMMLDVLERRYSLGSEVVGLTHLTTNLSSVQIDELYGQRIRSRMREMVNAIYFHEETPDRRA